MINLPMLALASLAAQADIPPVSPPEAAIQYVDDRLYFARANLWVELRDQALRDLQHAIALRNRGIRIEDWPSDDKRAFVALRQARQALRAQFQAIGQKERA